MCRCEICLLIGGGLFLGRKVPLHFVEAESHLLLCKATLNHLTQKQPAHIQPETDGGMESADLYG